MLKNVKYLFLSAQIDNLIALKSYDTAMEKLNFLISQGYKPEETMLKRGKLCKKLQMTEEAYSDFTYIINHCSYKSQAYIERAYLNFEISNFKQTISDADLVLAINNSDEEIKRIKLLSLIFTDNFEDAKNILNTEYDNDKYKILQYLFSQLAILISKDEFAKGLKLTDFINIIDADNPLKLLNEANIYKLVGNETKHNEIMKRINSIFPKYFISHFRFIDMYQEKNLLEISFLLELSIFDKQNQFEYPLKVLEGYKNHLEGHITDAKDCFERAIQIKPEKSEAYVLLAQTLQLMSGYDNPKYVQDAENNYKKAMEIFSKENRYDKVEDMRRQIKHLNSYSKLKS